MRHTDPTPAAGPPNITLSALVGLAQAGDPDAYVQLYDATCEQVHGMVSRMIPDAAAAERVTESAYLRAFTSIATDRPDHLGVLAWLLDLAHTEALVEIRLESPADRQSRILAALEADETAVEPDQGGVWSAMGRLTGSQRRTLHLAYFGGFEHAEVGSMLGMPRGAASVRMSDGLRALRDHLESVGLMAPVNA